MNLMATLIQLYVYYRAEPIHHHKGTTIGEGWWVRLKRRQPPNSTLFSKFCWYSIGLWKESPLGKFKSFSRLSKLPELPNHYEKKKHLTSPAAIKKF